MDEEAAVTRQQVVVGVNEVFDEGSEAALRWAAQEAAARRVPLRIVCAWESQLSAVPPGLDVSGGTLRHRTAERVVMMAAKQAGEFLPAEDVIAAAVDGPTLGVVVDASRDAGLLVLGSRGLGRVGSAVHGSIGIGASARASCPVVVLRGPAGEPAEGAKIIAGVDTTAASQDVLEFAFDTASRRGVPLQAVLCWHPDLLASMQWRREQPPPAKTEAWLAEAVAGWRQKYPDVTVSTAVIREHAPKGLLDVAEAQWMLVVGRASRHPVAQALLGSTSHGVLHHATLPVAVVPTPSAG